MYVVAEAMYKAFVIFGWAAVAQCVFFAPPKGRWGGNAPCPARPLPGIYQPGAILNLTRACSLPARRYSFAVMPEIERTVAGGWVRR